MTNSATPTPAVFNTISSLVSGAQITLYYTTYNGWSGKVYGKGRVSGVSAGQGTMDVTIGKTTEKAYQLISADKSTCWVPKSKVSVNDNGRFVVNRGFCYMSNFPEWKRPFVQRSFNPTRTTML